MRDLGILNDGALLARDGVIVAVGLSSDVIAQASPEATHVDASGSVVMPGFVDAHTHPVFAGTREDEYEMRVVRAMPGAARPVGATCWTGEGPAIAGAMWDAPWMGKSFEGPDGRHLIVMLPNGREWAVDGRANNCTMPDDTIHRCWIRHGEPPNLTVDKRGNTCSAGAGSIQAGDYHGFLRAGHLVE